MSHLAGETRPGRPWHGPRRWLPLIVLASAMSLAFAMGWHRWLTLEAIGMNYADLRKLVDEHLLLSLATFAALYVAVVALSLPGGLVMTIAGGLLFGWQLATPAIVVAATLGATIVFVVARATIAPEAHERSAPWLAKLRTGFMENALAYMLFLRLVPVFPFVVVNFAPALLGVPLSTFVIATFIGIMPGTLAFAVAGSGLGSAIQAHNVSHAACLARIPVDVTTGCTYGIDPSALVTKELVVGLALLGVMALVPVAAKKWSTRHAAES